MCSVVGAVQHLFGMFLASDVQNLLMCTTPSIPEVSVVSVLMSILVPLPCVQNHARCASYHSMRVHAD